MFEQDTHTNTGLPHCSCTACGRDEVLTENSLPQRKRKLMPPANRESREEAVKDWSDRRHCQSQY